MAFLDVPTLALSPDGRKLAFTVSGAAGQTMIHVRAFDQPKRGRVPGTEGARPFFSPDGASLGFFADRRLRPSPSPAARPRTGGRPQRTRRPVGALWLHPSSPRTTPACGA